MGLDAPKNQQHTHNKGNNQQQHSQINVNVPSRALAFSMEFRFDWFCFRFSNCRFCHSVIYSIDSIGHLRCNAFIDDDVNSIACKTLILVFSVFLSRSMFFCLFSFLDLFIEKKNNSKYSNSKSRKINE